MEFAPKRFRAYYEPFLGGGAFYFALHNAGWITSAVLNDLNPDLINAFNVVKDQVDALSTRLEDIQERFRNTDDRSDYYYRMREEVPAGIVDRAGRFIFLNKTCYNGLYRVNRRGQFNVPFGRYHNPSIYDPRQLRSVSNALSNAELHYGLFQDATVGASSGDFVYFDPPYQPLSRTANFTAYTVGRFGFEEQRALAVEFDRLASIGVHVMLSNSDHSAIEELYSGKGYRIREVLATRLINCDASKRGAIAELIVTNY